MWRADGREPPRRRASLALPHAAGPLACLAAALDAGIDACSLSFVRGSQDIAELREQMARRGRAVPIIAKLEKAQAVTPNRSPRSGGRGHGDVARGDLGAETAHEMVRCSRSASFRRRARAGVPTITATEMLESMIHEPRPTRAEPATWPTRCSTGPTP